MDTFFNHDVADWLRNSVSKMDDAEAEMFTLFTVYEVHKQDIENNRRTLDRHIDEVQKSILADLHPEIRQLVAKAFDPNTPYEEKFGKPQPRGKGGRWSKFQVSVERGKESKPQRGTDYRQDKIKVGDFDLSQSLSNTEGAGNTFSERWTESGPRDHSTNERTYRRVQAGAQLLGHVPNKNVQAAAALGEFAGKMGPEAEKIIGPAARRTAYRYRGTERMPDDALYKIRNEAMITERKRLYSDEDFQTGRAKPLDAEQRMAASEAAAANYLFTRLPKKGLATLQRESGKLPPSEGVIINRDGEIVTQAVGYNEDHYLPFNLKNLKGLQGGAYVRTRSTGGLTSEDIYTGLVAGARSITVVSRSGVFTLDFEDDLRGGRRYSDKARQMVGRYAQTLDAVQSEKVSRRGLTPDERAEIREEVEHEMEGMGYKNTEIEAEIKNREREFSRNPQLSKTEVEDINRKAMEAVTSGQGPRGEGTEKFVPKDPKKAFNYYRSEFMDAAMEDKQNRMYRLDAEGYEAAMEALQEQFPYYVARTKVHKIPRGNEKDSGYVRPNYNRPKAVQAGFFDEEINGKGKFAASQLHYQNYRRGGDRDAAAEGEGGEGSERKLRANKINVNEMRAQQKVQERRAAAVGSAAEAAKQFADPKDHPALTRYKTNPDLTLWSNKEIENLIGDLDKVKDLLLLSENRTKFPTEAAAFEEAMTTVERTGQQMASRVPFNVDDWNPDRVNATPQMWAKSAEHEFGAEDPTVYQNAFTRVVQHARLEKELRPDMDDAALRAVQKKYSDIYSAAARLQADPEDAKAFNDLSNAMIKAGADNKQIEGLEERFDKEGVKHIQPIADAAKEKALAAIQARSIVAASQGRMTEARAAAPAVSDGVIQGQLADTTAATTQAAPTKKKPVPMRPLPDVLEDLIEQSHYGQKDAVAVKDLAVALTAGDDQGAEDALDSMSRHVQEALRPAVHEHQRKRDLG